MGVGRGTSHLNFLQSDVSTDLSVESRPSSAAIGSGPSSSAFSILSMLTGHSRFGHSSLVANVLKEAFFSTDSSKDQMQNLFVPDYEGIINANGQMSRTHHEAVLYLEILIL